jgi:hypothetical protein
MGHATRPGAAVWLGKGQIACQVVMTHEHVFVFREHKVVLVVIQDAQRGTGLVQLQEHDNLVTCKV